jgi:hypothetical protein
MMTHTGKFLNDQGISDLFQGMILTATMVSMAEGSISEEARPLVEKHMTNLMNELTERIY